jgi:hypothetical protein
VAVGIVVALFAVYAVLVTWQMRRALRTREPASRLREAKRLLLLVAAGLPLVVALIFVAF